MYIGMVVVCMKVVCRLLYQGSCSVFCVMCDPGAHDCIMELSRTGLVQRKICLPQDPLKSPSPFSGFIVYLEVCEHIVGLTVMCFGCTFPPTVVIKFRHAVSCVV